MTGWRFKNCVIQALGGMWWCLAQIKACWLVHYRPWGMGGRYLTEARSHGVLVFFSFIFSSGGHLVQQRRTVWAILVEDHPRNILVKLLKNLSSSVRGNVCMLTFMENQPLLWLLKAWWTDRWINKQINRGEFGYFGLISNIIPNIN